MHEPTENGVLEACELPSTVSYDVPVLDARTTQFMRVTPRQFLDFAMDVERYQQIDEKIRPVLWARRHADFTEFAFRPRVAGVRFPKWVAQMRLDPERNRIDISLAPAPHNRIARLVVHYEASFECTAVDRGVEVVRSERFRPRHPFRWATDQFLRRVMPRLVEEELLLAKELLESTPALGGDADASAR